MDDKMKDVLLWYQFSDHYGNIQSQIYRDPIKVIQTNCIEEVIPCLKMIEEEVKNNYYAAGYISYEAAPAFDSAFKVNQNPKMPLIWFGIFEQPKLETPNVQKPFTVSDWVPSTNRQEYETNINKIKQSIQNGDTYQVNYTIRLHAQFKGNDLAFFHQLFHAQTSQYSAYLNIGDYRILSASPELFFRKDGDNIITKPMKGTMKRGLTVEQDEEHASWLYHSEKNRAENLMIVDLLRNDLGVIAKPGTVEVPKLFEIEKYPTVHQMTSTITAQIDQHVSIIDIFQALFPCGSITGAPKIKTMEIISQLESEPRDVYCGTIGYISPNGEAVFNVPIRTVTIHQPSGRATYGVGGGITWDSTSDDEYEEVLTKANILKKKYKEFQLLETILVDEGNCFLLEEHLLRLSQSAKYFNVQLNLEKIRAEVISTASHFKDDKKKIRLTVEQSGKFHIEVQPIHLSSEFELVVLGDQPIKKDHVFLYHKTTNRDIYQRFHEKFPDAYDVLLWNEDREITEFTNGNVVLEIEGKLLTPPVSSGLLPGTFRKKLLNDNKISEARLTVEDLKKASSIWFINSVRKWVKVVLQEV